MKNTIFLLVKSLSVTNMQQLYQLTEFMLVAEGQVDSDKSNYNIKLHQHQTLHIDSLLSQILLNNNTKAC